MHPSLVFRKKVKTASVAFSSPNTLWMGPRVLHPHAFPIFHIALACGAQALHLATQPNPDCRTPLAHNQHSLLSIIRTRSHM